MYCIIYKITNLLDQKCYVGQTWQSMKDRFIQHACKNDSKKLFNAMKKYGINNFIIECLTIVSTQSIADYYEIYFISKYNSNSRGVGYNISNGGKGVGKHSYETKSKISDTKMQISKSNTGRKLSEEQAKNIGTGHIGLKYKVKDPETRNRNISEAKKKKNAERRLTADENKQIK